MRLEERSATETQDIIISVIFKKINHILIFFNLQYTVGINHTKLNKTINIKS